MYRNFEKLPDNKKELILKAAAEEFVEKGYYNANTEIIAKKSKISKGSLFNYFKSKKGLFIYLVEYTREMLANKIMAEIEELDEEDFFDKIKKMVIIKHKVLMRHPAEAELVFKALMFPPAEVKDEMKKIYEKNMEWYRDKSMQEFIYNRKLLEKISLRVDVDKVIKIISFILEELSNKYIERFKSECIQEDLSEFIDELDVINDIIKYGVIERKK